MPYDYGFADTTHAALVMQQHMDQVSNNLANVNTTGFKADRLIFNDLMSRQIQTAYDQGSLRLTDNPLDVALSGEGFFMVRTPHGDRLTRDGSFKMLSDGALVTSNGLPVLGAGGEPIVLNPNDAAPHISENGTIFQEGAEIGRLMIMGVENTDALIKEGYGMFVGKDGQLPPLQEAGDYSIEQGMLEMANVEVMREMVNMINTHRSFESYQKAIQVMQDMDSKTTSQVGRIS